MRKALIYILAILCMATTACENTIEEFDYSGEKKLAVFGILNTAGISNRIYCYYMDGKKLHPVNDAKIKIYVNGSFAEEVTEFVPGSKFDTYDPEWWWDDWDFELGGSTANMDGEKIDYDDIHRQYDNKLANYIVKTKFKPGDNVRLEVSSASCKQSVWAETDVPMPADASIIDTLYTKETIEQNGSDDELPYYKMGLKIRQNTPGNYRLLAGFRIDEVYGIASIDDDTYEKLEDFPDSSLSVSKVSIEVTDDIALTDGKGYYKADDGDFISMDTYYYNHYRIVAGDYFNGGEYNASFFISPMRGYDIPTWKSYSQRDKGFLKGHIYKMLNDDEEMDNPYDYPDNWDEYPDYTEDEEEETEEEYEEDIEDDETSSRTFKALYDKTHTEYLYYQVYSMPDVLFHYLKMRSNQNDVDFADSPFVEPVVLKSNINGGLGIFAIEAVTEGKIELKTPMALPSKTIYY